MLLLFLPPFAATIQNSDYRTTVHLCHDSTGIQIKETAYGGAIFSVHDQCNSHVWENSSVLETFIAPIVSPLEDPQWYWEIDTTPTSATFASLIFNGKGNSNNCSTEGCVQGELECTGSNDFSPHQFNVSTTIDDRTSFWTNSFTIPWTLFPGKLSAYRLFRMNFYRYAHPALYSTHELSAWSPTHSPSFHVPQRFGVVVFD